MSQPTLTAPAYAAEVGILFSAYGVEWGYRAFAVTYDAARERLGARDQTPEQLLLAFQLNRQRIARAAGAKARLESGERVVLDAGDFAQV